jgi:hypothetical protein
VKIGWMMFCFGAFQRVLGFWVEVAGLSC